MTCAFLKHTRFRTAVKKKKKIYIYIYKTHCDGDFGEPPSQYVQNHRKKEKKYNT